MDVSVIIVNYKTSRLLVDAIDSIFDKTEDLSFEVIVRRTIPNSSSGSVTATV